MDENDVAVAVFTQFLNVTVITLFTHRRVRSTCYVLRECVNKER